MNIDRNDKFSKNRYGGGNDKKANMDISKEAFTAAVKDLYIKS
jgi:hypothetical protein